MQLCAHQSPHVNFNVTRGSGLLEAFLAKRRMQQANRFIPPSCRGGRIADIGCGSYPLFLLHTSFQEKYGLDKVVDADYQNRFADQKTHFEYFDMEQKGSLPFANHYFNVVVLLAVFEHIEADALAKLMAEIHRVLQPNGLFIITTPAPWTRGLLKAMAKLNLVSAKEIEEHKTHYSPAQIIACLERGGFQSEKMKWGYFECFMNTWVVARK